MESLLARSIVYLLFGSTFHLSCVSQQVPSCGIVKETLGTELGTYARDTFTSGTDLQCRLNQTCCSSQLEELLMKSSKNKQRSIFLSILSDSVDSCFIDGKFESSAAEVISSAKPGLVSLISSTFEEYFAPHKTIFDDFYAYLAEIPRTLDMCALKGEVHKVLFKVYRATVATASKNEMLIYQPEIYQTCLFEFFLEEKSRDIQQFYKQFEKSFARFWYFIRSRKVLLDVMNEMVMYLQFTDSCNTALLHATECAKCSGYTNIQVCNDFCMNLFRGCLIDFKELGVPYNSLHSAFKSLEHQMRTTFDPDRALSSFHSLFLNFITATVATSVSVGDIPSITFTKIVEKCGPIRQVSGSPTSGVSKRETVTGLTLVRLAQDQMICFDKLHNLFNNVELKMCEANNATTVNNNNSTCWNGKEFGSYNGEVLDANRIQQQKNKDVFVSSRPSVVVTQLSEILEATARDVRYLLSQEICDRDDEDNECIRSDDYCNILIIPRVEVDYSGSGEPPTVDFWTIPNTEVNITTTSVSTTSSSTASTITKSQIIPYETNTPSKPTGPTLPPEWTIDPDQTGGDFDEIDLDVESSSIYQSLCKLLLSLTAAVVFLC